MMNDWGITLNKDPLELTETEITKVFAVMESAILEYLDEKNSALIAMLPKKRPTLKDMILDAIGERPIGSWRANHD
jgi:6-phosphogluconate dehydrogenase